MHFNPLPGGPKDFLARDCACLPPSGFLPFYVLDLLPGPCRPQVFPVWGPLPPSACLPQPHTRSSPPNGINQRPSPLPVLSGGDVYFLPCPLWICLALHNLFRVVSWCLLNSWFPIGCTFVLRREAWAPPLPINRSPRPPPLRYSDMSSPFRLPGPPPPLSLFLPTSRLDPIPVW